MTHFHTIRVPIVSAGDGLFDALLGGWRARGWTIHAMDNHGVLYEARKTIPLPTPDEGERLAA
ncbi:hypothetical protein [Silvimonas sp.]|uniref:hypothetical protein n=1 Tax=Silvimonas sp. TaxID=2650811 RepID=UPI002841F61A|nr:hypothetical protein [Silvimonas sp.]MDR3427965.1 hypothetical protein [Silvimonas sp.]